MWINGPDYTKLWQLLHIFVSNLVQTSTFMITYGPIYSRRAKAEWCFCRAHFCGQWISDVVWSIGAPQQWTTIRILYLTSKSFKFRITFVLKSTYRKTFNISRTLVGNKIVDHSDVLGASPVGAAPTTSSFSTWHLASRDSAKIAARQYETLLSVGIWCVLY